MARCSGCSGDRCSCKVIAGANISVTGAGTLENPLVISAEAGGAAARLPGEIIAYGATAPPAGWLVANGSAVSRTIYAALFAIIGTTYGTGDGTTTFNLPDLAGAFPLGADGSHALGAVGGQENVTLTIAQLPSHVHSGPSHTHTGPSHSHSIDHDHGADSTGQQSAVHYHQPIGGGQFLHVNGTGGDAGSVVLQQTTPPNPGWLGVHLSNSTGTDSGQPHTHVFDVPPFSGSSGAAGTGDTGASGTANTGGTGSGDSHTNMPPWTAVTYLIKT